MKPDLTHKSKFKPGDLIRICEADGDCFHKNFLFRVYKDTSFKVFSYNDNVIVPLNQVGMVICKNHCFKWPVCIGEGWWVVLINGKLCCVHKDYMKRI